MNALFESLVRAQSNEETARFEESVLIPKIMNGFYKRPYRNQHNALILTESFFEKIAYGSSDCWYWIGSLSPTGYGCMKQGKSHRIAYELFNGAIKDDKHVLHKCDVRNCVNPDHLFLGTHQDNMADMKAKGRHVSAEALKTHCPYGHAYDALNTYRDKKRNGARHCRECGKTNARKYRRNKSGRK